MAEGNNLAQGYVFFGPSETKLYFAKELAGFLENKKWEQAAKVLIDTLFIEPGDYAAVKAFLWQKPIASLRRTVVINNAHQLTIQAQGAILKIAEEPPASALIILIVNDPDSLMATLASRFQKIYFGGGNSKAEIDPDSKTLSAQFLKAPAAKRKEIIKQVVEDEKILDNFIKALFDQLRGDPVKNQPALKELLNRWSLISRYNVNKKLQLEAWTKFLS